MNTASIASFVQTHWLAIIFGSWILSNVAVAITPQRYQTEKWYGLLLRIARWSSAMVHADESGTLAVPFTKFVPQVGAVPVVAPATPPVPHDADVTAKIDPVPPPGSN